MQTYRFELEAPLTFHALGGKEGLLSEYANEISGRFGISREEFYQRLSGIIPEPLNIVHSEGKDFDYIDVTANTPGMAEQIMRYFAWQFYRLVSKMTPSTDKRRLYGTLAHCPLFLLQEHRTGKIQPIGHQYWAPEGSGFSPDEADRLMETAADSVGEYVSYALDKKTSRGIGILDGAIRSAYLHDESGDIVGMLRRFPCASGSMNTLLIRVDAPLLKERDTFAVAKLLAELDGMIIP